MNEDLIYNLLYKSGLLADGCWNKFDEYDKEALNKYTQLIIEECVKGLKERIEKRYAGSEKDQNIGYGMEIVYDEILTKFGLL